MGVLREDEFDSFLKRRLPAMNGILIHGADQAAVAMLGSQVAKAVGSEAQRVDVLAAKSSPGSFLDQLLSLSLLGDRQLLLVEPVDENCLKFLEPAFAYDKPANFAVLLADSLGKTSKLRSACEASTLFVSLAVYEEDQAKLRARTTQFLVANGLMWSEDAEEEFFAAVGTDRAIVAQEAEKLALFAKGQAQISAADVQAICGDTAEYDADELIDAVLAGDLEQTDRIAASFGGDTRSIFALLQIHVSKLQGLSQEMERGMNADQAVRNAKPPIFFKRKPAIMNQLRILTFNDLIKVQEAIQDASLQSRKFSGLADAVNNRTLLSVARMCRQKSVQ